MILAACQSFKVSCRQNSAGPPQRSWATDAPVPQDVVDTPHPSFRRCITAQLLGEQANEDPEDYHPQSDENPMWYLHMHLFENAWCVKHAKDKTVSCEFKC